MINCLIFALYIFLSKYNKSISNILLAFLMLAITLKISYIFGKYLLKDYTAEDRRLFAKFVMASYMSVGPLFFLYIKSIVFKKFRFTIWMILLFIPGITYIFLPRSGVLFLWNTFSIWGFQAWFLSFILLAGIYFYRLKVQMNKQVIEIDLPVYKWIRNLFISVLIIWSTIFSKKMDYLPEILALFSFILYIIIFSALGNFKILNNKVDKFKYISGTFKHTEILKKIEAIMKCEQPYLESDFSLPKFAEKLQLPVHTVSAVLNNFRNQNFAEFTNYYRIEEAKKRLLSDKYDYLSIEGIAYDCGYNSLSTFNSAFKKYTHLTPGLYKRQKEESLINS